VQWKQACVEGGHQVCAFLNSVFPGHQHLREPYSKRCALMKADAWPRMSVFKTLMLPLVSSNRKGQQPFKSFADLA